MRKKLISLAVIAGILVGGVLAFRQKEQINQEKISSLQEVRYTNLAEVETKEIAKEVLTNAGISQERQKRFFDSVTQFENSVSRSALTNGFEKNRPTETKYDPYQLQEEWNRNNKEFQGYNCRITACSLIGDFVKANPTQNLSDQNLIFDLQALEQKGSVFEPKDYNTFHALFDEVGDIQKTKDVMTHVSKFQETWKERGVKFLASPEKISLISVVFHDEIEEGEGKLFVGHTGILVPNPEGGLYFIEKVAFQEPYRMNSFENRTELNDYLMKKYDVETGQPTAIPFIMENDHLMEGYRPNPEKVES